MLQKIYYHFSDIIILGQFQLHQSQQWREADDYCSSTNKILPSSHWLQNCEHKVDNDIWLDFQMVWTTTTSK